MSRHRDHRNVTPRFPLDPWTVRETEYRPEENARSESIFALGNGYIGLRGTLDEGAPAGAPTVPGSYLNGFHERAPIDYPEGGYGLAEWRQTMLNVTDAKALHVYLDGAPVRMDPERTSEYVRELDLRAGTLTRRFVWTDPKGKRTRLEYTRAVSLEHRQRVALRVRIEALDGPVEVAVSHALDGAVANQESAGDPRVGASVTGPVLQPVSHWDDARGRILLRQRAPTSGMELACAADHQATGAEVAMESASRPLRAEVRARAGLAAGEALTFDARVVYLDARDHDPAALERAACDELDAYAAEGGVDGLLRDQRAWLDTFWDDAGVELDGDEGVRQSLHFSLFHLVQGVGRDGRTNIPAKALTGEGYEGHTFWDTEIYLLPVFLYVRPGLARALLEYRIDLLPAARERARSLHHEGALYPWRTIAGPEASAFFPAGTAQYHIDADIAHAFERYVDATDDRRILWEGGAAVVMECARFFAGACAYGRDGHVHLHTVTGPDEYTALVDDNHYTNKMAQATLRFAARLADDLAAEDGEGFAALKADLDLGDDEPKRWAEMADAMYLPVDRELGVTPQDASFLGKPEWPWDEVPAGRYPLLLHYHNLDIYRHQVIKQADVLLAHYLRPDGVSRARLRRDAAYYAPRTTHDSSLSPCVHAIVAADLGDLPGATDHFRRTARMDLDDLNGNVKDGVHAAAMGGTWLALVEGFGGFRVRNGEPSFHPRLPDGWRRLSFRIAWRGRTIRIDADPDVSRYLLVRGEPVTVRHRREPLELKPGDEVVRSNRASLRGVVFDLDGVLTDSAELHYRAWKALADEIGAPFDREANESLRGIPRMESLERILALGGLTPDEDEKRAMAARKNAHYVEMIQDVTPEDLLPGIARLLDELRDAGVPLALASSSRNGPALLARLGIADRLQVVVDPAELGKGKPDPEIFERAAEALGLPPEDCVGVEDAEAGVRAIRGANMTAVGVGDAEALAEAHVVVAGTAELSLEVLRAALREADGTRVDTPGARR